MAVNENKPSVGLIGLGTMGASLALNIAEKGYPIAVFNRTTERMHDFVAEAGALTDRITGLETLDEFVEAIAPPRAILVMVPAGEAVDEQIAALLPKLGPDDLIMDCGNANFRDTQRRAEAAKRDGWQFLGIGVSGGKEGARHGPSIMGGGSQGAWQRVEPMLRAISAKHTDGTPCATWMGEGGAGHFVKMVHNGIEYADMQMIAEVYGVMRDGMGMSASECGDIFAGWNSGILKSYLIEISAEVSRATDPQTGKPLLDIILDSAGQKGTGRWTAIEAQHLAAPVSVIEAAVGARNMSAIKPLRLKGEALYGASPSPVGDAMNTDMLEHAMIAGKVLCYAQGFDMLARASSDFNWSLPLPDIARVWRAGCIIRSAMLDDMATALAGNAEGNLVFDSYFAGLLKDNQQALRETTAAALSKGHPVPALSAGLAYFDTLRTGRSTANMIQAQRDFFGLHGFKRIDKDGDFHGPWDHAD